MHVREYLPKRCQEEQAIQAGATAKAASFFQATKLTFSSLNFSLNMKIIENKERICFFTCYNIYRVKLICVSVIIKMMVVRIVYQKIRNTHIHRC